MKLQKHFIRLFTLLFLVLSLALMHSAVAQQDKSDKTHPKGLILFDFPESLEAKVEVNLTAKLINLVTKSVSNQPEVAELIQMLDGIYVRTYDRITIDEKKLVNYFRQRLKKDKWEVLVKIKEESEVVEISLLFDEDTVYGIFVIVIPETSGEATFVNIVGQIAPEHIEELLGSLSDFGAIDIDVGGALKAQAEPSRDTIQREILAVKVENPPTIDATLDDACWKIAPQADGFTHVRTGNPVEDDSKVKLVYTHKAIYVAWHLNDSQLDKIVARQSQDHVRFGKATEDWVSFSIDPFHTHRFSNRTFFMANPLGKKYVHSPARDSNETEWMEQWNVAANIVEDGWVVEMEIPWQMLDYPDTTEPIRMGINFDRGQTRTNEHSWWSNIGVREFYKNDGHWLNVLPPPKSSGMQGLLDAFETEEYGVPKVLVHDNNVSLVSDDIFRPMSTSGLNRVDGLRLGGGFEVGQRSYLDPLFFSGSGSTIRQNARGASTLIDSNENNFGRQYHTAPGPFLFGTMSYALSSRTLNYRAGGGMTSGENFDLTYGLQIHRLTSVRDRDILLSSSEQFFRALWGTDFQDYYLREGAVMALQWQPMNITHSLGLSLLWEEHKNLENRMHFHLRNWAADPTLAGQRNPSIHDGSMHSISLKYDFDNRGNTTPKYDLENRKNTGEWYNTFLIEHASPVIGSDFDFTRFLIHLRHYSPIGNDRIDTRLKVGFATDSLPFQRQFVIGGIGTLRGYSLYEFVGNHGFLFNFEYVHSLGNDAFIIPFVDIGQAWYHLKDVKYIQPKINLGIGFQGGPFRLNLARSIEEGRGYQVDFKWSRMF
ncbi:MAG: DUF4252 domain-containing protein [Candidatus Poribacteria bacterium]|nr:DUF4252 domain-containing protein [Candidatus Poribacteria bacterium]